MTVRELIADLETSFDSETEVMTMQGNSFVPACCVELAKSSGGNSICLIEPLDD